MADKTFEENYKRLGEISEEIKKENLPLSTVKQLFREGMDSAESCLSEIDSLRIEIDEAFKRLDSSRHQS